MVVLDGVHDVGGVGELPPGDEATHVAVVRENVVSDELREKAHQLAERVQCLP